MYYDNKSSFYMKQYGIPAVIVTVLALIVGSGLYIYWNSSTKNSSQDKVIVASDGLKNTDTSNAVLGDALNALKSLEKSDIGTVTEVKEDGSILVSIQDKTLPVYFIGIDSTNISNNLTATLQKDLVGKEVRIAFDQEKTKGENVFAYVYIGDTLYNISILENGLAGLKDEKNNKALLKECKEAQAYAKQLNKGIWN